MKNVTGWVLVLVLGLLVGAVGCSNDPSQVPPKAGEVDTTAKPGDSNYKEDRPNETTDGPQLKISAPESPGATGQPAPMAVKGAQCSADPKRGGC